MIYSLCILVFALLNLGSLPPTFSRKSHIPLKVDFMLMTKALHAAYRQCRIFRTEVRIDPFFERAYKFLCTCLDLIIKRNLSFVLSSIRDMCRSRAAFWKDRRYAHGVGHSFAERWD